MKILYCNIALLALFLSSPCSLLCSEESRAGWSISESLLYWHGYEQGIGYTNQPSNFLDTDDFTQNSVIQPSFQWAFGFRVDTSYTLREKLMSFIGCWTYIESKAKGQESWNSEAPDFLGSYPIWSMGPDTLKGDYVFSASANWHLYTNIVDFSAQYQYACLHRHVTIMPLLGIRGVSLHQKLTADYSGGVFFSFMDENHLKSRILSIGPRLGCSADILVVDRLSLFGRAAIASLFGHIHRTQQETFLETTRFQRSESAYQFVLSTDYELGVKWKRSFRQNRLDGQLGLSWEWQEFFFADAFYLSSYSFFSKHRSIYLQGLSVSAGLDF